METNTQKVSLRLLVGAGVLAAAALAFSLLLGAAYAQSGPGNDGEEEQAAAAALTFKADLTGDQEVPAVVTAATGEAQVRVNDDMTAADFRARVNDGIAVTQSHLHCAAVGQNGPVIAFLFGLVPGGFDVNGDLAQFTLTDANILPAGKDCAVPVEDIASLTHALQAGIIYANVHTVAYPNGEIRGQLMTDEVALAAADEPMEMEDMEEMMEEMEEMMEEMMGE